MILLSFLPVINYLLTSYLGLFVLLAKQIKLKYCFISGRDLSDWNGRPMNTLCSRLLRLPLPAIYCPAGKRELLEGAARGALGVSACRGRGQLPASAAAGGLQRVPPGAAAEGRVPTGPAVVAQQTGNTLRSAGPAGYVLLVRRRVTSGGATERAVLTMQCDDER